MLATFKTFGPKIKMSIAQQIRVIRQCQSAGLHASVEACWTGSVYVTIYTTTAMGTLGRSSFYGVDLYSPDTDEEIAKIRLSGHDEGVRQDSTHVCVGSQRECMNQLNSWLSEIILANGQQ